MINKIKILTSNDVDEIEFEINRLIHYETYTLLSFDSAMILDKLGHIIYHYYATLELMEVL